MSEFQSIAKGLLGLTHPEVFASFGKRADAAQPPAPPAKPGQSGFSALIASLGRGAWLL
ncbi:MAG TPA: hypothetical protein VGH12_07395 [Steroidobacteraceae bacterium]|jgi:hypothetical protein